MVGVAEVRGALTEELGVVFRLRDCRPSRPLGLLFPNAGGIVIHNAFNHALIEFNLSYAYKQDKLGFIHM